LLSISETTILFCQMVNHIRSVVLSARSRFVFLHVPKTAGGSLKRALLAQCPDASSPRVAADLVQRALGGRLGSEFKDRLLPAIQSSSLRFFVTPDHPTMALTLLSHPLFWQYHRFAFVRNPFDRIVSAYEYARQYHDYQYDFAIYVGRCERYLPPQVNYLFFHRKSLVDWVGRFERLKEDLEYLARWLELPKLELIHRNRTVRGRFEDYTTPSLKRHIAEVYQADFTAFQYASD